MTTKEMELKLAKDIARIRIIAKLPEHGSTLAEEMVRAMKDLDAAKEAQIFKEINDAMANKETKETIQIIMTPRYVQEVTSKLQIRVDAREKGSKTLKKFSEADYKKAVKMQSEEINKAADLIVENMGAVKKGESTVINAIVAELYAYEESKIAAALKEAIGDRMPDELKEQLVLTYIPFTNLTQEAVEHLEKVQYHGKWIYERFQPAGIIRVDLAEEPIEK